MDFVKWSLAIAFLSLGSLAFAGENTNNGSDSLTAEQLAAIDAEIEQLSLSQAQAIGRSPAVMAVPEVDSGLDQGE